MKIRFLLVSALLISVAACKKDSQDKPKISVESINSVIPVGGGLDAKLNFSEPSGKLGQGTFTAIRNRLNQQPLPPGTGSADTLVMGIPDFPDKSKGEFEFTLDYSYLHQSDQENDTIQFKFAVSDRLGNKSDTVTSGKIVILYQ